jgi:DNA-directed RNA polymerase specialized sigma24 family protein
MSDSPKTASAPRRAPQLSEKELDQIAIRLLDHAKREVRNANWAAGLFARAHGETVEDLVQRAILTLIVIDGRRGWDADKHPDPWTHLKSVVNSFIADQGRLRRKFVAPPDFDDVLRNSGKFPREAQLHELGPDEMLDEAKRAELGREASDRLVAALCEDDALTKLHDILEHEPELPRREIAKRMGVTPDQVTNLFKRLDRQIEQVAASITRDYGDHS